MQKLAPALLALLFLIPAAEARPLRLDKAALDADRAVVSVMQTRDRGRIAAALSEIRGVLQDHPESIAAHRLYQELAAFGRRDGRLVEAEYRHWLEQSPDDPMRRLLHASAVLAAAYTIPDYLDARMVRDMESRLVAAEAVEQTQGWAHFVSAELESTRERTIEEAAHIEAAWSASPAEPAFRYELVRRRFVEGKHEEAADLCLELADRTPWRVLACGVLWEVPTELSSPSLQEKFAELLTKLARIEKRKRNDFVTLQAVEELYAAVEDGPGMTRVRERLAQIDPDWVPVVRLPYFEAPPGGEPSAEEVTALREIYSIEESLMALEAKQISLERMQGKLPDSPRVKSVLKRALSEILRDRGDKAAGRDRLREAMELRPDDPSLRNAWAYTCALDAVDLPEALKVVDESITSLLGAHFSPLSIDVGETMSDWRGKRAESAGAFIDTKGWLLHQLGRYQEAVEWLQLAALLSDDGTVQAHLGRARHAIGNDEAAFLHLLRALAIGTEEEEVVRELAESIYSKVHVVPGGLDALIDVQRIDLGVDDPDAEIVSSRREPSAVRNFDRRVGEPAPRYAYERLTGGLESSDDFYGKVVVLEFWASWCGPCRATLPMLSAMKEAFGDRNVEFIALSVDDSMDAARGFWEGMETTMRVGLAEEGVADAYDIEGIPLTVVIDQDGNIASVHQGFEPTLHEDLVEEVVTLLHRD